MPNRVFGIKRTLYVPRVVNRSLKLPRHTIEIRSAVHMDLKDIVEGGWIGLVAVRPSGDGWVYVQRKF